MVRLCGESYFLTLGIRLLSGRPLEEPDVVNARRVAVVNETLALRYFGNEDPLGKRISLPSLASAPDPVTNPVFEVVGVVSDAKNRGIQEPVQPEVFLPHAVRLRLESGITFSPRDLTGASTPRTFSHILSMGR
jgi:putative ABC transport system permease protein